MKKSRIQNQFLEELSRTPIVQVACERLGISRQTYYRWRIEDSWFAIRADDSLEMGVDFVNDHAESNILNGIKRGDLNTSKWWLSARHKAYKRPFPKIVIQKSLSEKEDEELKIQKAHKKIQGWMKEWESRGIPNGKRKYTEEEREEMRLIRERLAAEKKQKEQDDEIT